MKRGGALTIGALLVLGVGAFASCREATQITLVVTTDAQCLGEGGGPTLRDTFVASAVKLPDSDLVAASVTDQCTPEDGDNTIGTLVLVPGGDEKNVEVVVIGGVDSASFAGEAGALALGADECRALIAAGESVQGKPCIVVRRRLGFVDHKKLRLPVKLDRRCIGVDCEEDKTCFAGNCVSAEVTCDESSGECKPPDGCDLPCDDACVSGSGVCEGGSCTCLACDDAACDLSCGEGKIGACNGEVCNCGAECDQTACDACSGTCVGGACECSSCDPAECGMTTCADGTPAACDPTCTCQGCVGCASMSCALGQQGNCESDNCVCRCDDTLCSADCTNLMIGDGGSCSVNDTCNCHPPCDADTCGPSTTIGHVFDHCEMGFCHYRCDSAACAQHCGAQNQSGACTEETETGECECSGATTTVTTGQTTSTGPSACMQSDCGAECAPGNVCSLVSGRCDCECDQLACATVTCPSGSHPECQNDINPPGGTHCGCVLDQLTCVLASPACDGACAQACAQSGWALACTNPSQPCICNPP